VIFAIGCGGEADGHGTDGHKGNGTGKKKERAITVRADEILREPISSLYSTSATLRADRHATVTARTRGVVRRLAVEEGNRVSADQPLAYLEDDEQKIAAARARTTEETARRDHERLAGLYERGLVSVDEFETSRRDAEDAAHALDLAELELHRTVIRAPIAGIVVTVYDLADLDPLYADINIPERHVRRLGPGQEVLLTADSTGIEAQAIIERIAPAVDPATGTVKVTVAIEGDSGLRPGAFVRVNIVTDTHTDAMVVARSALVAEGRRWHLYRLTDDGTSVEQIEVELGFETGDRVEIVGAAKPDVSISAGDRVVVTGAPALSDGAKIRLATDDAPEPTEQVS
jgi:membrane fusion protein (multidrug efflux system)